MKTTEAGRMIQLGSKLGIALHDVPKVFPPETLLDVPALLLYKYSLVDILEGIVGRVEKLEKLVWGVIFALILGIGVSTIALVLAWVSYGRS